ncbi:MAG: DUF21 domain-containing protein [Phycisphaerales bacterium]|nr:DUF21 domain-containing protein [Phycisphaerales bacterium]
MIDVALILLILGAVLMSAFFSGTETGMYCMDRLRLHLGVQRGERAMVRLERVFRDETSALGMILAGTNLANYLVSTFFAIFLTRHLREPGVNLEIVNTLVVTAVAFIFGEAVPKTLFQQHADFLLPRCSAWLWGFNELFRLTGVTRLLKGFSTLVSRIVSGRVDVRNILEPRHRVAALLRSALVADQQDGGVTDLIDRVLKLSETQLGRVMVPRSRTLAVRADTVRSAFQRIARSTRYSRLPVYDPKTQRVLGYVVVDRALKSAAWTTILDLVQPALTLRPDDTVASAIARAREARQPMMIIVDPQQRMLGIATLKDLLEEIVGELPAW